MSTSTGDTLSKCIHSDFRYKAVKNQFGYVKKIGDHQPYRKKRSIKIPFVNCF
ncbi:hypothetical protein KIN20_030855 [Parelaphostrongylus tenuis]|uniref:Uncharacterized protein n=1 Tax=Parelaphostrongylus tenuis TaxID=148309 RepID=A0AAD5WGR8_PARTN|nr:hypothetical protein KIN20_030855 [Parelaphostrongylus tenuis]